MASSLPHVPLTLLVVAMNHAFLHFFVLEHRFMDMHEVVNEVSRPVTAASSRKGLGLTREYCVLVVAALRRHDAM